MDERLYYDPVGAIKEEIQDAIEGPMRLGYLEVRAANDDVQYAKSLPDPQYFFHGLFVEAENTVVFSQPNTGKSLFMVQVAESIPGEKKVLLIDCEHSSKQFQLRYTDPDTGRTHPFPNNLYRAQIKTDALTEINQEQAILASIEEAAINGFSVIIVDNISFVCSDAEKSQSSIEFMSRLIAIKKQYNITTIVVAHTPKRDSSRPLNQNDLAGSSKLMALFDSAIAIGVSARDPHLRYVKTVKFRSGEYPCPADHVAIYRVEKDRDYTKLTFEGYGNERDHLREKNRITEMEDIQECMSLKAKGLSLKEIAEKTGMAKTTVYRRIKQGEAMESVPIPPSGPSDKESFRSTSDAE